MQQNNSPEHLNPKTKIQQNEICRDFLVPACVTIQD
jgi:hypothetical protein